jgi:hypothetical protein
MAGPRRQFISCATHVVHQRIRGSGSHGCAFPRHDIARVMHLARPSKEGGRRECRVQAAPMARLQQKNAGGSDHRQGRSNRHSLRDGFTAYRALSLVSGL